MTPCDMVREAIAAAQQEGSRKGLLSTPKPREEIEQFLSTTGTAANVYDNYDAVNRDGWAEAILKGIADGEQMLAKADNLSALHRRLKIGEAQAANGMIYNIFLALQDAGYVSSLSAKSGSLTSIRLTDKGWDKIGREKPIWI